MHTVSEIGKHFPYTVSQTRTLRPRDVLRNTPMVTQIENATVGLTAETSYSWATVMPPPPKTPHREGRWPRPGALTAGDQRLGWWVSHAALAAGSLVQSGGQVRRH